MLQRQPHRPVHFRLTSTAEQFDAVVVALKHRNTDIDALRPLSPILIDLVRGAVEATESISSPNR